MDSAIRKAKLIRNIGTDSCLVLGGHKTARMDLGKEATYGFQIYIKSSIKRPSKKLKRVKSKGGTERDKEGQRGRTRVSRSRRRERGREVFLGEDWRCF